MNINRNLNHTLDTRELMTGRDGRLFVEAGDVNIFLAEIESYSLKMNVNAVDKQPVGSIISFKVPTGVQFELTLKEMVVRDDVIIKPLLDEIKKGNLPWYNFQSVAVKPDGTEQRFMLNNAVPSGSFDLQTLTPGEVITREQTFTVNSIPDFITSLKSTYIGSATGSNDDE